MAERAEVRRLIAEIVSCADDVDGGKRDARGFARKLVATVRAERQQPCVWNEDEDGTWESTCGEYWQFIEGGPVHNGVRYCHGCGRAVKSNPYADVG